MPFGILIKNHNYFRKKSSQYKREPHLSAAKYFYKVLNPTVTSILQSKLHTLLSKQLMIVFFKGKKTGRSLSTPVRYLQQGNKVSCLTVQHYPWYKNFTQIANVELLITGKIYSATAQSYILSSYAKAGVSTFLSAHPKDALIYGIKMDKNTKQPQSASLEAALHKIVYIEFLLND